MLTPGFESGSGDVFSAYISEEEGGGGSGGGSGSLNGSYRYGFNGKENDNEVKGTGNQQDYGMRIYDTRIGKFLSVDPISSKYPELTPYQFASNRPIDGTDLDGKEWASQTDLIINWAVGTPKLLTTNYLKVKVINESKIVNKPDDIKAKAELFAKGVESKLTNVQIPLKLPDEIIQTKVILDFTPPSTDDEPGLGILKFDDRQTTSTTTNVTVNGKAAVYTETSFDAGKTNGQVFRFNIRIAVTKDGVLVQDDDFINTSQHEAFHSAGGQHIWKLSPEEKMYAPEIDQMDPILGNINLILENLMNSRGENPDPKFIPKVIGSGIRPGQIKAVTEIIKKETPYTVEELKAGQQ